MRLLLASASPRRAGLLRAAGFVFDTAAPEVDERPRDGEAAEHYVGRLAREKAYGVRREPGIVVLGADTTVVVGGRLLGKPACRDDARAMLEILSGRVHEVLTGVVLAGDAGERSGIETSRVRFLPLTHEEVAWYVASGEPDGKAGGYAIQGRASRFVDRIEGSYSNVVGLPVSLVYRLLRELGWHDSPARRRRREATRGALTGNDIATIL